MGLKSLISKKIVSMILSMILKYLQQVSPDLIKMLDEGLEAFQEKAAETANPIDDIIANLLRTAFDAITGGDDDYDSADNTAT